MKSNLIARRKKAALASAGNDPWVTDRDEKADAKAPETAEVPRLAAESKTAQPAVPGAPPAAPPALPAAAPAPPPAAPASHGGAVDLTQISSEGLAKMIKALSGVNDLLNDKALLAVIEKATELLKGRPAEPEAPAQAPAPRAASAKKAWSGEDMEMADRPWEQDNYDQNNMNEPSVPSCNQCEMLSINGVNCHETGCPNEGRTWSPERQEWVSYNKCPECGSEVEEGQACDCMVPSMEHFCLGGLNVASFEKEAVTPPGISEETMHELKADPGIDEPYAVAWSIHNKKKEGSFLVTAVTPPGISEGKMHELKDQYPGNPEAAYATAWKIHNEKEGSDRTAAGAEGSWWVNVKDQTGKVEESGGRTPEVEEAHGKVDEKPAKLDRPETTLPEKLAAERQYCTNCHKDMDTKTAHGVTHCTGCDKVLFTSPSAQGGSLSGTGKKAADGPMKASTALKRVETLADRLKEMYLDAKEVCDANDSRPVREAVEAIYRAYDLLGTAAKVLGKQDMQEKAEADAIEAKGKAKKKGSLLDSLVLAAAE